MIRYTHTFDFLYRVVIQIIGVYLGSIILSLFSLHLLGLNPFENVKDGTSFIFIIKLTLALGLCLAYWGILHNIIEEPLRPLPTWLYLRIIIFAPSSWEDAKSLSFLLHYKTGRPWYHLREALKLPRENRIPAIKAFADQVLKGRQEPPPMPQSSSKKPKDAGTTQNPEEEKILWAINVLELPKNPTAQEIKKAYRKAMKKHHPDTIHREGRSMGGFDQRNQKIAEARAKEINYAYEILKKE